jgi:hypothetical protein
MIVSSFLHFYQELTIKKEFRRNSITHEKK